MPITIGSNIASLSAQRRLSEGTAELSKTYERMSSGQRINRASDDAAGLSISESLKSDTRVFNQGIRNFNDGISLLNIADGAIESLSNITIRLKELAEQSANGTYSATQRKAIDKEAQALSKEYTRIVHSTKFNGIHLLDGSLGNGIRLQGGFGTDGSIFSQAGGAIGSGTFGAGTTYSTAVTLSTGTAAGDVNGDGITDFISGGTIGGVRGFAVSLGIGNGTFTNGTTYTLLGTNLNDINLADINNDGILDVLATGSQTSAASGYRLGNGDGTFGNAVTFASNLANNTALSAGDINGDGNLDIVVFDVNGVGTVSLGNGNGSFATVYTLDNSDNFLYESELADFNGDGIIDLVTAGNIGDYTPNIVIRMGRGDGTFGSATTYVASIGLDAAYSSLTTGDINGDGISDIVGGIGTYGYGSYTTILLGSASGTFTSTTTLLHSSGTAHVALGDINGDGKVDLLAQASVASYTFLGQGDGTFGNRTTIGTSDFRGIFIDTNMDGVLDIVNQGANVQLGQIKSGASPLLPFDITTLAGARQALPVFDQKIQQLAKQRGQIGAFQSRVQVGINNLQSASENYSAAEGRIRNADIADESSKLLRLNILQQAASSVLSQANLQPQLALKLLKN